MEKSEITDAQLKASSYHSNGWYVHLGRLNNNVGRVSWLAGLGDLEKWFQVDFILIATIVEIWTQGSNKNYAGECYVKTYHVHYAYENEFQEYTEEDGSTKVFSGNFDVHNPVVNSFSPAIVARLIRVYPKTAHHHPCLRLEFWGFYKECSNAGPLGMQDERILNNQITGSYEYPHPPYHPYNARLNWKAGYHWWGGSDQGAWLQVSFQRFAKVVEIATQGRWGERNDHWVKTYSLSYGNDGKHFYDYAYKGTTKVFNGNFDRVSVVNRLVDPPIVTRYIRIQPLTWNQYITLAVEFYGCYLGYSDSCENIPGRKPLGMENFQIKDSQINASSEFRKQMGAVAGRLNFFADGTLGGAWGSLVPDDNQWFQVDFLRTMKVTGVVTQGRHANHAKEWTKEYTLCFKEGSDDDDVNFQFYKKQGQIEKFIGNTERESIAINYLDPYINARILRINPKSQTSPKWHALRVEFYGFEDALIDGEYADVEKRVTASSWLDHRHQPYDGIISGKLDSTSWTPAVEQKKEYIQVDLLQPTPLAGVELRGAADFPSDSYTELFMYHGTIEEKWELLKDKYGKKMRLLTSICYQEFDYYVLARYVRLLITRWGRRTSFRFQLHEIKAYERTNVGIEKGIIRDDQLKSSNHPEDPNPAYEGRLNFPGAWCGNTLRKHLYLQVDFLANIQVHAVATQGKFIDVLEYVKQYKISTTLNEINWNVYKEDGTVKLFPGNRNCRCSHKNFLKPFLTRSVRILPTSWVGRPCMRIEVFGVYKGILTVHARSGTVFNKEGKVMTRQSSIKLNGKEVIDTQTGYNIVVANYITGELVTSTTLRPESEMKQMNDFLRNISDRSVVVISTQNVTELPRDDTLSLLETLGAIRLRYSMASEHGSWILVGYKGQDQVDWIAEKIGNSRETIKVAVFVPLNQRKLKPKVQEYFQNPSEGIAGTEMSLEGRHTQFLYNINSSCGSNNTECREKLSLGFWMKNDVPKYTQMTTSMSKHERFVFKYYSNGYKFIVPKQSLTWYNARSHCLAMNTDLAIIPDEHAMKVIEDIAEREGIGIIYIGLTRHPNNLHDFRWVDGSELVFTRWQVHEPNNVNEKCVTFLIGSGYNDFPCDIAPKRFICQQPIEDITGLQPLGMENDFIPDSAINASSIINVWHDKYYARPNTQRNDPRSWCADTNNGDNRPYLQVDLSDIKKICGVGTMGRGQIHTHRGYPVSYFIQLSNDSFNWTFVKQGLDKKVFQANEDENSMVINRFHRAFLAQFIKIYFLNWNKGFQLCARVEIFSCKEEEERNNFNKLSQTVHVPRSIKENIAEDCLDVLMAGGTSDGVYVIDPGNEGPFSVYCDQTTAGGGWTVFQRRMDGAVDFYRTWDEYAQGFGDPRSEHWLGNDKILRLTNVFTSTLRVDLERFSGKKAHSLYGEFKLTVGSEDHYIFHFHSFDGPGGNALGQIRSKTFSAKNKGEKETVAQKLHGGWWYTDGEMLSNLNGKYYSTSKNAADGIYWKKWTGNKESLKRTKMMMRSTGKDRTGVLGVQRFARAHQFFTNGPEIPGFPRTKARLNYNGHWKVANSGYYLQINLNTLKRITHLATQGGTDLNYVKEFYVRLHDESSFWKDYKENGQLKIFEGNDERTLGKNSHIVSNCLYDTGFTRKIRIHPLSCSSDFCSLRMELYSCENSCSSPLGVSNGLPDDRINASSWKAQKPPHYGRLSNTNGWFAENLKPNEFLQVNFLEIVRVTAVATVGSSANSPSCFVKSYVIMYKDTKRKWKKYKRKNDKVFHGNINAFVTIRNEIEEPFLALSLRFVVKTWHNDICLKTEIYGCYPDNPKFLVSTDTAIAGRDFHIKGRYRYCEDCECPGCKKSICLRVFGKVHTIASRFSYDCLHHDFEIPLRASEVPGVYKVYISDSDQSDCNNTSNERMVGSIAVTEGYTSCLDLLLSGNTKSGQYSIDPDGNGSITVYCDQEKFGGGWTVFQRRVDGSESFNRDWATYKHGFGDLEKNFWLGNDFIHRLAPTKRELLLDLNSEKGDHAFVLYKSFQVNSEEDLYRLHVSKYQDSVANCMQGENGKRFTTYDRDHDNHKNENCAVKRKGGWWFSACGQCHLNGVHGGSWVKVMKFNLWTGNVRLNRAEMKTRKNNIVTCNEKFCYYLLKTSHHWLAAREECRRFHADLLSVHDADENQFIVDKILQEQNIDQVHLEMRNITTWTDGSKVLFNNFKTPFIGSACPVLQKDGSWKVQNCNERETVVCKRGKYCFKEQCFIYNAEQKIFADAQNHCRDLGYDLVKVSSKKKQDSLMEYIHSSTKNSSFPASVLLGLKRFSDSTAFSWIDGTFPDFNLWAEDEPNEPETKFCTELQPSGVWNDAACDSASSFLCEKDLDPDNVKPKDCLELLLSGRTRSGVYSIDPDGLGSFQVYCDQDARGGGWTVIMRRADGIEPFNRTWKEYRQGFGSLDRNFWLGNDLIHRLTETPNEVIFDIASDGGDNSVVLYKNFKVGSEKEKYKLTVDEFDDPHRSDTMSGSNGMFFTTEDADNDQDDGNCAVKLNGGWWHKSCAEAFLTGTYEPSDPAFNMRWGGWILSGAEIKIRRKSIVYCFDEYCIYRTRKTRSWLEAIDECRSFNSDLPSASDQYFVNHLANLSGHDETYLGLGMGDKNTWTDGTTLGVDLFTDPTLPADKCVILKENKKLTSVDCNEPKFVVCKRGKDCYKGDCYHYKNKKVDYDLAVSNCTSYGYNLPKISSRGEHQFTTKIIRVSTKDSSVPIVFTNLQLVGSDYQWADGTKLQYNKWVNGEPNGLNTGERRVSLNSDGLYDVPDNHQSTILCEKVAIVRSCSEVSTKYARSESGYYSFHTGRPKIINAYCDLNSPDGAWTVLQRRVYNTPPLNYSSKTWANYKDGFGDSESNFWLGNKNIHELTKTRQRLKITLWTADFNVYEAIYEDFTVGDEASKFVLNFGAYSGTAGDSLSYHRGMKFSTVDEANFPKLSDACTSSHPGGWWFNGCVESNLNGVFTSKTNNPNTVYWKTISQPIIKTEMKMQAYNEVPSFMPDALIQNEISTLGLTFNDRALNIDMQTSHQHWRAMIPKPGPFTTHVAITWEDHSYLRYYENGTLLAEVAAVSDTKLPNPNKTNIQFIWLNEFTVFDRQLDAKAQYQKKILTFDEEEDLWNRSVSTYQWNIMKGCTSSIQTGPCGDHTSLRSIGSYAYAEASPAAPGDQTFLKSRNLLGLYNCLSFWYHIFGSDAGSLNIYLTTNSTVFGIPVRNISGNRGNFWRYMEVDININSVFKVVFEATRDESFYTDIAIDDVTLSVDKCKHECIPPCGPGEKCDHSTLLCHYEGIYDHRWKLNSLEMTNNSTTSVSGRVDKTEGAMDGAVRLKEDGKIIFRQFDNFCDDIWCFPYLTISFWLKYEEVVSQDILMFGDLVKVSQNSGTPEEHISFELNSAAQSCKASFFVPSGVWSHIIVTLVHDLMNLYFDGKLLNNSLHLQCTKRNELMDFPNINLVAGGSGNVDFALDDVRVLFDVLPNETVRWYKANTGIQQTIFIQAKLTSQTWSSDLLNDESKDFTTLSKLIQDKVMETLADESNLTEVIIERFRHGSVVADVSLVYDKVSYQDILLVEEALFINNSFNGLDVQGIAINSTSVSNVSPSINASSPNSTALIVNWTDVSSFYLNGVFQGYKLFYRETHNSSYTKYSVIVFYGNHTGCLITDLQPLTNYTIRVLAFTLSGDGLLSDGRFSVNTLDGPVTDSPNVALTNISSSALYANWTILPNSTEIYKKFLGYYVFFWKQSDINSTLQINVTNSNNMLLDNLEKWTTYCFNVSGYTAAGIGPPSETRCTKTMEDAPEKEPANVTIVELTASSIKLQWSPPEPSAVPGIIRFYNLTYRLLNTSDSEITSLTEDETSYTIVGLRAYSYYLINISAFTVSIGPTRSLYILTNEAEPSAPPADVSLVNVSSTALQLNWTVLPKHLHNGVLLGYRILIWNQSKGIDSGGNMTVSTTTFNKQIENLLKWTSYCVQVAAFNRIGDGPFSNVTCSRTFEDAPEEPPRDFKATQITKSSMKLEWLPPSDDATPGILRQYNITYRNLNYTDNQYTEINYGPSVTSHTMEQLIGLTLYEINITSSTIRSGPWDSILVLTKEGVPNVLPNISWYNLSSTSIKVEWSEIPPPLRNGIILGYTIYLWKQVEGPSTGTNFSVTQTTKIFENLEKYTFYCGQVAAYTKIGEGPRSPVECIRTSEDAPEVSPTNLNTTNVTWSSFFLTWDPIDPSFIPGILRSYHIKYKIIDPRFTQFNGIYDGSLLVDGNTTSVNVTGLIGWTQYEVLVTGVTIKDGPANITYLQTEEGIPKASPDNITNEITSTTIIISWKKIALPERHGKIKGYKVTYQKQSTRNRRDVDMKTLTTDADTLTTFIFKLKPYTNYTVTLAGFTSKGVGTREIMRIETLEGIPGVSPKNAYGVNFTSPTTIFAGWGPLNTDELQGRLVGYEVRYRVFSVADEIVQDPPREMTKIIYSDINGITLTGLSTFTTYTVSVAALSGGGTGVKSDVLYVATCRCSKRLTTNYWNIQPYTNISRENYFQGFFPHLLNMVTLACCQTCLEHGTSEIDYFRDGQGNPSIRTSDIDVKRNLTLATDFSFPIYGFEGQESYSKYYGYSPIVQIVGTVFFVKKPDYSLTQGKALLQSVLPVLPFIAITVLFAYIAGVIIWALEHGENEEEYPQKFIRGAANGFWWAYISMTTVGYGDKTARTIAGRVFAVVWVLTGLVISSLLIGSICTAFTTSTTPPQSSTMNLYGAKVAALQDSPDHKLGVRRNAKVNTMKQYWSLNELKEAVLNDKVDGILIDTYVTDSRRDLFQDTRLQIKQVIDLKASYGVVLGENATKLRKCFKKFWKENNVKRNNYIEANSDPVVIAPTSVEELLSETFNPQGYMYSMTLIICVTGLGVGFLCGCVYEIIRLNRRNVKVQPEAESYLNGEELKKEMPALRDPIIKKIEELQIKHRKQIHKLRNAKEKDKDIN
ncbi:uncharacterized protein LOC114517402 [Dendronephthya gigantea]|uniref:uncharacterized protein LOC114517402 n=1 Tax=Dendronephthya gigantea TaxID=151771 RepID=UPI0010697EE7|nr:uncharacterized protein LOC114517402 [Dendronephthya gigantea]